MDMISCLYDCQVRHARLVPKPNSFSYRVFYLYLDLDELEEVRRRSALLAVNRGSIYSFWEKDHWPIGGGTLKQRVVNWLNDQGSGLPADVRIRLVTLPRAFGYVFNPVSFFFCFDADGKPRAAVAEVANTFGESKLYLLPDPRREPGGGFDLRMPKEFYVSPFIDLDVDFEFRLDVPDHQLDLRVDDWEGEQPILKTALRGTRRELTTGNLLRLTLLCPMITVKVISLIHWQALLLWLKNIPWFTKAARPERQRKVMNPHRSTFNQTR